MSFVVAHSLNHVRFGIAIYLCYYYLFISAFNRSAVFIGGVYGVVDVLITCQPFVVIFFFVFLNTCVSDVVTAGVTICHALFIILPSARI